MPSPERDVVLEHGRMGGIGDGAEESALDLGRNLALDLEVADGDFDPARHVAADEVERLREGGHGTVLCEGVIPDELIAWSKR